MYTGSLGEAAKGREAELLAAADKYSLLELKRQCEKVGSKNSLMWMENKNSSETGARSYGFVLSWLCLGFHTSVILHVRNLGVVSRSARSYSFVPVGCGGPT